MFGRTMRNVAAGVCAVCSLAAVSTGDVITQQLYYTRYFHFSADPNVKKTTVMFDTTAKTVTFSGTAGIADTGTPAQPNLGADGIRFAPDGDLLIGGQQIKRICKVNVTTGTFTSQAVTIPTGVWILTLNPNGAKVWGSELPGALVEVPIPFGPGTTHPIAGDDSGVSQIAFVPGLSTVFYVSSPPEGNGSFGTIDLTTFQTHRVYGPNLEGTHGIRFDLYSKCLILSGGFKLIQIDPFTAGFPIVSTFDAAAISMPPGDHIDQVTPDMHGIVYGAGNDGTLVAVDYRVSKKIGDASNPVGTGFLDSFLDGVTVQGIDPGACCLPTGECVVTLQVDCQGMWTFGGTCVPNVCPQPGRCCNPTTGACTFVLQTLCPEGSNWTPSLTCTPDTCPKPGQCCNNTTGVCTVTLQVNCIGGTWTQGLTCSPDTCPKPGQCCNNTTGVCSFVLQSQCPTGSTWTAGLSCTPDTCPKPGQCCNNTTGACSVTLQANCTAGTWTAGLTCTPDTCPKPGRCCNNSTGACSVVLQAQCGTGSTWTAGLTCTPDTCPKPGACCDPAGMCTFVLLSQCAFPTTWHVGVTCQPNNPCPQPGRCCDATNGNCSVTLQAACAGFWTQGGTCTPDLCPKLGPCCNTSNGQCTMTFQTACAGLWSATGACSPNPCPQLGRCCNTTTGACSVTFQASCSGNWTAGANCTPDLCPKPGLCCDTTTGACSVVFQTACSGTFTAGQTCSPDLCPKPGVCCNTTDGGCTMTFQTACTGTWSQGGVCNPNPCPQLGQCCSPITGICSVTFPSGCSGVFTPGGNCSPSTCPPPPPCCPLGTGDFDGVKPELSQVRLFPPFDARVADDFYLLPGNIYKLNTITVTLLTNQTLPLFYKAQVELYDDCDGLPMDPPFQTLKKILNVTQVGTFDSVFGTLNVLKFTFDTENLVLRGGKTYWVSAIGLGSQNDVDEVWFWGSAGNGIIQGSPGKFKSVASGVPDWIPIETLCCGCRDFSFCIDAMSCKILIDNGTYDPWCSSASRASPTSPSLNVFTADQFVVPPDCQNPTVGICYIEAYLYSNCPKAALNIYDQTCVVGEGLMPNHLVITLVPDNIMDLGPLPGVPPAKNIRILKLQFWPTNLTLSTGMNYWLSAYGVFNGSANQVAYFACNKDCNRPCLTRFVSSEIKGLDFTTNPPTLVEDWTPTGHDSAFLVALTPPVVFASTTTSTPKCAGDFNGDGHASIQDLFDFLSVYFTSCQ